VACVGGCAGAAVLVVVVAVVLVVVEANTGIMVLLVVELVEPNIELDDDDEDVVTWHWAPQLSSIASPTALLRIRRASLALTVQSPSASQSAGAHATIATAARSANRASVDTGLAPVLTGCPQSPWPATEAAAKPSVMYNDVSRLASLR
jgi:hypothetical protein